VSLSWNRGKRTSRWKRVGIIISGDERSVESDQGEGEARQDRKRKAEVDVRHLLSKSVELAFKLAAPDLDVIVRAIPCKPNQSTSDESISRIKKVGDRDGSRGRTGCNGEDKDKEGSAPEGAILQRQRIRSGQKGGAFNFFCSVRSEEEEEGTDLKNEDGWEEADDRVYELPEHDCDDEEQEWGNTGIRSRRSFLKRGYGKAEQEGNQRTKRFSLLWSGRSHPFADNVVFVVQKTRSTRKRKERG
jgi:hypothetical protein